jgi:exonuclease III
MKITSWNIRGMNSPSKQRMLKEKISRIKVDIFLLQETKCDKEIMERITQKIWPEVRLRWIAVEGYSGGLATLWDPDLIEMQHFSSSSRHLTLKFRCIGTEEEGYITNVWSKFASSEEKFHGRSKSNGRFYEEQSLGPWRRLQHDHLPSGETRRYS